MASRVAKVMTQTSATCPRSNTAGPCRGGRGFTLLELVVVLALLGLATALVAPSGFRMIESWRRATEVDASLQAIAALGANAANTGRATELGPGEVESDARLGMPPGWVVHLDTPLRIQANGACSTAQGRIRGPGGYELPFETRAPFCTPHRVDAVR